MWQRQLASFYSFRAYVNYGDIKKMDICVSCSIFLAGVTLKTDSDLSNFIKKKAIGLLIPYISFSLISMAIYEFMLVFLGMEGVRLIFPHDLFVMLYGNSRPGIMKWNTPL